MNQMRTILTAGFFALLFGCSSAASQQEAKTASQHEGEQAPLEVVRSQDAVFAADDSDKRRNKGNSNKEAKAELEMMGKKSSSAGELRLTAQGDAVRINGDFEGLPAGTRAIKILDAQSCDKVTRRTRDYNPTEAKHGPPEASERHVGDLGNITVNRKGEADFEMVTDSMTIGKDSPSSVLGKVVVVTRSKDDGKSQPDGNAGLPIACGVIK